METTIEIESIIEDIYEEVVGEKLQKIDFNVSLEEKGLDSLEVVDLIYNIEDSFNLKLISKNIVMQKITLRQIVTTVEKIMQATVIFFLVFLGNIFQ